MITKSIVVLERFSTANEPAKIDRTEVCAHAIVDAWVSHWPSRKNAKMEKLLAECAAIRERERSRWKKQRRIAIGRIALWVNDEDHVMRDSYSF